MVVTMSRRLIPVLAAFVGLLLVAVPTAAATGWSAPVEIYDGNYSEPSLVVDAHGYAHVVARGDTGVWYLTNKSGTWKRTRLTTDYLLGGEFRVWADRPLITMDRSNGKIVVVYLSRVDVECLPGCPPSISYVTNNGKGWSVARYVPFPPFGQLSIAARNGDIAIAAVRDDLSNGVETQTLDYLHKADGWAVHRVADGGDSGVGSPSLALDSAGLPRIAFVRKGNMKYAVGATTSGDFSIGIVTAATGYVIPSLALDLHDRPMIVWPDGDGTHYARRAGAWYSSLVMPGRYSAQLAVDGNGAHVVSSDGHQGVWYGTGTTSANWTSQQVADARVKEVSVIGVAPNGRVEIAYQTGQDSPRIWFTHTQ
jgi:hypothetical protein